MELDMVGRTISGLFGISLAILAGYSHKYLDWDGFGCIMMFLASLGFLFSSITGIW